MGECINLKLSQSQVDNITKKQFDIVKRMIEKKTSAEKLKSFIEKINEDGKWNELLNLTKEEFDKLTGDKLVAKLTEVLINEGEPEYKKYTHRVGRPLFTLDDFNRAGLTSDERKSIKEQIKFNIVDKCLFDISGSSGEIRSLEKINENILRYKLSVMLDLAKDLGIKDVPIRSIDDILYHPQNNGEELLQDFYDRLEYEYGMLSTPSTEAKFKYNLLTFFDAILLSTFENVIELDPEYKDDGYIYVNKYVYKGPGANMRKGFQDNLSEGYADAFENMANLTKMIVNFVPRYMFIDGEYVKQGYIGDKNAVFLFAELWDFVVTTYHDPIFQKTYATDYPNEYLAITQAIDNPADADWNVIVKHYINTKCAFGNPNIRECMYGLYKHVFEKGKGTWLYEDFVSCIQKYRKTSYGIISKVRKNEKSYMEFNELRLWTEQYANFQLQDQLAYSAVANHIRYNTAKKQAEFAKKIGLKQIDSNSFSLQIDGQTVTVTIKKAEDPRDTTFSIDIPTGVSDEAILKFLSVNMSINISKEALQHLQTELHSDDLSRRPGEIRVKSNKRLRESVAPLFGLWVNSVFDKEISINGETFKPIMSFDKRRFGDEEMNINNFSPFYTHLWSMSSILQIVHNENTANVIKNGKGNNVPTTQLATIQQDGPVLFRSVQKAENEVKETNIAVYDKELKDNESATKGKATTGFQSISQYNPTLSQPGFCRTDSMLSAGITNGAIAKESKELKAGELLHNEIIYLFAQGIFSGQGKNESNGEGTGYIYSQSTANADKNLQTLRGLALDIPIAYTKEVAKIATTAHQNRTLRTIIEDAMKGDDRGIYEYYALHNAKALLALENNICHSYNCAFAKDPDWVYVHDIDSLMSQLIKKRHEYLKLDIKDRDGKFDWTLSSVKKKFKERGLDFNETTFGISAKVKGSINDGKFEFECVQFAKDMVRDFQIAKNAIKGNFKPLAEQSSYYEKTFIQDLISEVCDINTITDNYFKEMCANPKTMQADWVTNSGDMIFATFEHGGRTIKLTAYSNIDDINLFKSEFAQNVKINPILHAYHIVQFAVNTQMTEAYNGTRFSIGAKKDDGVWVKDFDNYETITMETVVSDFGSDDDKTLLKKKAIEERKKEWHSNYLKVENARMVDYYKRATVNGTREHRILHGGKYNIPEKVYTATIEDPEVIAILNSDESVKCKAQDGSIWVTPWHALQMDVGAGEAKLPPGVRKTMYHDIDPITGGATLLKMAEFVITNEMRRLSQNDKMNMDMLLMKLANRSEIKLGTDASVKNAIVALNSFFEGNVFFEQQKYNLSAKDFGKYYAFKIQVSLGNSGELIFTKTRWEVSKDGNRVGADETLPDFKIKTIYQIDRILGGCYSCDLTKKGLVLGESQNKIVNKIICELGLKENYTAYAVNKESIKNNIKNVNSADEWYDIPREKQSYRDPNKWDEISTLWTSKISTKFGGIILNALHEMDEDVDVARGVQMLSEMIQNGNDYGSVEDIYSNVRLGIQDALKKYTDALDANDKEEIQKLIFDTIIDSLTNGKDKTKVSLAQEFVLNMQSAREEKNVNLSGFPISDKALYDLLITTIVGRINKTGIRARNSGFGGVKHPSVGVAAVYDVWVDKGNGPIKIYAKHNDLLNHIIKFMQTSEYKLKYSDWTAQDFMDRIDKDGVINPFIELSKTTDFDIDLGETIIYKKDGKWERYELSDDKTYQHFKRFIEPTLTECYRDVFAGRRLRGYRTECTYVDANTGKEKHDLMLNTDSRYLITSVNYVRKTISKIQSYMDEHKLWDDSKSAKENILSFIDSDVFANRCVSFIGTKFKENYTIEDLKHRINFLVRFFSGENDSDGFTRFSNVYKNKLGVDFSTVLGTNKIKTAEDLILFKNSKDFENALKFFLHAERLIGVNQFAEDDIFEVTIAGQTTPTKHKIKSSKIRKAEYMKSKGNVSKQYQMDREDSMFDVISQGEQYFVNKLSALYTPPADPKLLYDVVIYDKARRPIYLKFDPNHKYAEHFAKQKGEYYPVRSGLFKESHGYVYYKDKEICSSNQMTTWTKHGENGEKYTVLTIFDRSVFDEILKGKYGKHDGLVSKVVPNLNINWDEDAKMSLNDIDKTAYIAQWKEEGYVGNNPIAEQLAKVSPELYYENMWNERKGEVARSKHQSFIRELIDDHLVDSIWKGRGGEYAFEDWIESEASQMYQSFLRQRSAIGTRIPSQAMQSMMAMECVGYIDADYNEEMASAEMTYIQGSDYDIDKDYITEYFVDETGFVSDGSKLRNIKAFAPYVDSFPVPNAEIDENGHPTKQMSESIKYAKAVSFTEKIDPNADDIYVISYHDAERIIDWINNPEKNEAVPGLFRKVLNEVNKGKKLHIALTGRDVEYLTDSDKKAVIAFARKHYKQFRSKEGEKKLKAMFHRQTKDYNVIVDDRMKYIISDFVSTTKKGSKDLRKYTTAKYAYLLRRICHYINQHQTSVVTATKESQNISLSKELAILSDPRNIAAMEVSVDLSLSELKDFAEEHGNISETGLSVWSAASKFKAQDTNLLGKTGVGVAANADKVYFTVYYYHTKLLNEIADIAKEIETLTAKRASEEKINEKKVEILRKLSKVLTVNPFNQNDIRCISKLNWNIVKNINFDISEKHLEALSSKQRNLLEVLKDKVSSPFSFQSTVAYMKTIGKDKNGKDIDGPTLLSALVSAATDNAKELVLSKLNAFGDILDAYGMCATLGIPFEETATIFTSPLLNVCVKEIRGDIYDPTNFASKLEGSFGMYFAKFEDPNDTNKINSILSPRLIGKFTKDESLGDFNPSRFSFSVNYTDNLTKLAESSSGVEQIVDDLKRDNRYIDDIIDKARTSIKISYSDYNEDWESSWEEILDDELEMYDDTVVESDVTWESASIIQKIAYISYLKRLKLRNNAVIGMLRKDIDKAIADIESKEKRKVTNEEKAKVRKNAILRLKKEIDNIENISEELLPKLYEQQILHKMLGVTKGVASQPQQLYRYIREMEYFVNKKYKQADLKDASGNYRTFEFIKFFKDPDYAQEQIELYDKVREFTNVLECLYTNEYIGEMLKTVGDTNSLLSSISFVYGNTQKVAMAVEQKLGLSRPLNHKEFGVVSSMINEWLVYQYLTYHSPYFGIKLNIDPSRGETVYDGPDLAGLVLKDNELRINKIQDIGSFKRLANLFFFPDLLEDYAENTDAFCEKGRKANMFMEAIICGGYSRIVPNAKKVKTFADAVEEMVWKIAYNMNEDISDESSEYALQLKKDFEVIFKKQLRYKDANGNWVDRGITIGDFIYLYNLIVYKNSGTRNSFTKLFENAESLRKMSKLLPQYNAFVAAMDSEKRVYNFIDDTNFMDSVILKLGAMKNSKLKDTIIRKYKPQTSFIKNSDYPFDFVTKINPYDDPQLCAKFYDEMSAIITHNTVDKTDISFEESGIYYVQESLLPVNPDQFVEEFGNKFVWITKQSELIDSKGNMIPKIKDKLENNYVIIVTDPNLAELCWTNQHLKRHAKKGYVHNISEFNASPRLISIVNDMNIVQLPNNFSFITVLENTINPKIMWKRPLILQDSIRRLWDQTSLTADGFDFNDFVKFETAETVAQFRDHRRFAKAWFEYTDGSAIVHINIDVCNDEHVIVHEMAHLLLLMNKAINLDKYHEIAMEFLENIYPGKLKTAWDEFKSRYPATIPDGNGGFVKLSDDLLFDEFLIDAVQRQSKQNWTLDSLIEKLRVDRKQNEMYKDYVNASKLISQKIANGIYEIKC